MTLATLAGLTVPALMRDAPVAAPQMIPFRDLSGSATAAPLTILEYGYAAPPGTSVPAGGLPVGTLGGHDTMRSFVRLSGQATVLHLALHSDRSANSGDAHASIRLCPVLSDSWQPRTGVGMEQSPAYDCASSAHGRRLDDGSWDFDLSAFPARAGSAGFAIIPGLASESNEDGPFQVTFSSTALTAPR